MINRMNYLLLITVMIAVIDNSYGRCCPCEKKEGEKADEKEEKKYEKNNIEIKDNEKPYNIIYNSEELLNKNDLENEFINNVDNEEPLENTTKIKETTNMSTNPIEDQNDDEKKLINQIIGEVREYGFICNKCENNKNSKSNIKLVYHIAGDVVNEKSDHKISKLGFGFCENHKRCLFDKCAEDNEYLFQCGHRTCKEHYKYVVDKTVYLCEECKTWMCAGDFMEGFGTHLLCNDTSSKRHYVCYKGKDNLNPYNKKNGSYDEKTWICTECKSEKYFE